MDFEESPADGRARRARRSLPLIAAALTVIVVAGLIYLHATAPVTRAILLGPPAAPQVGAQYQVAYDFVDGNDGWALVVRNITPRFWLFRTTDGARRWESVAGGSFAQGSLPSIQFFDRNHGIVQVDRVYRTQDGGSHLSVISVPDATPTYAFSTAAQGWALDGGNLFATSDGGLTWRMRGVAPPSLDGFGKGGVQALAFRADGEGWAGGIDLATPTVYSTADGGATWQAIVVPVPSNVTVTGGKPFFYSTFVQLLPGGGVLEWTDDDFGNSHAATSFDHGRSWKPIQLPSQRPELSVYSFGDARHWWASYLTVLYRTDDAGQTWKEVRSVVADNIADWTFGPAHMIDASHGWAPISSPPPRNASTGLAMSTDSGVHWKAVNVPRPA